MTRPTVKAALVSAIALVLVLATSFSSRARSSPARRAHGIDRGETREAKIERAMSAGPSEIARSAKIIDPQGQTVVGPHWMIMWPFDQKATGLPTTHRDTGAYIMWAGTPWAHVHVMGRPEGNR